MTRLVTFLMASRASGLAGGGFAGKVLLAGVDGGLVDLGRDLLPNRSRRVDEDRGVEPS